MFVYANLNTIFLFYLFLFFSSYLLLNRKRTVFKVWAIEDITED